MTAQFQEQSERVVTTPLASFFESLKVEPEQNDGRKEFTFFSTVEDELNALEYGAAFVDRSTAGVLKLEGDDVLGFLNRICTQNTAALVDDDVTDTLFLSQKGSMIDLAQVTKLEDSVLLIGKENNAGRLESWIRKYIYGSEVELTNLQQEYAVADFFGEQTDSFLVLLFGQQNMSSVEPNHVIHVPFETKFVQIVLKQTVTGKKYYRIAAPLKEMESVIAYAIENKGVFQFQLTGTKAEKIFRIRNGIPGGNEINYRFSPLEAGLQKYINSKKNNFLGKEAVLKYAEKRMKAFLLSQIHIEHPDAAASVGMQLYDSNGAEAGEITTLEHYPGTDFTEGLAYVKSDVAKKNMLLTAKDTDGTTFPVRIISSIDR